MVSSIHKIFNKGIKSDFARNTSTLLTGTVIAQVIPILIQPILRRYYPAEVFGSYAVYMSLIGILYAVASFRYEQSIILQKNDADATNIFLLSQLINFVFCTIIAVVVLVLQDEIIHFLNVPAKYKVFILAVPIGTFLFNLHQAINLWLIRKKNFLIVSKNKIIRRGVEGGFQISFRYLKVNFGLLLGDIIGHIVNVMYGIFKIKHTGFSFQHISKDRLRTLSKQYSEYARLYTPTTLINALALLLPVIIINKYYGAENAAYFDLSRLILLTPIVLIAGSISNVMLQRIAEKRQKNEFFLNEIRLIVLLGVAVALVEIIVIYLFGEKLFSVVFGKDWVFSGTISKLLIFPYLIMFFTTSLNSVFLALRRIKLLSVYQVINSALVFSLFFFNKLPFIDFIKVLVSINVLSAIIFITLIIRVIMDYYKSLQKSTSPNG